MLLNMYCNIHILHFNCTLTEIYNANEKSKETFSLLYIHSILKPLTSFTQIITNLNKGGSNS